MRLVLRTQVKGNYKIVMEQFDRKLFEALTPKQGKMEIVEFTGSKKGDRVHLRFLSPIKADWVSLITEDGVNEQEAYFVDEGTELPFPLRYWKHRHVVERLTEDTCIIVDDIQYKGPNAVVTALMYPALWAAFYPRKSVYRSYFGQ
jgi:ligand-binding SRPBCC domain-containing protein